MKLYDQIIPLLPDPYAGQLCMENFMDLEEIRLGVGCPLRLRYANGERELWPPVRQNQVDEVIQRACYRSAYAYSETISAGYLSIPGGHRIGLCGTGIQKNGKNHSMKDFSSLSIRIAREFPGCADGIVDWVRHSLLVAGPPGSGKTTLLRDLIRQLSDKKCQYVGLADERCEISSGMEDQNRLRIGSRTDVLLQIPKATAMLMLLRTMRPDWIAVDEITSPDDVDAMDMISYCGVKLLATAHASDADDLYRRPLYRKLMERGIFRQLVILHPDKTYRMEDIN